MNARANHGRRRTKGPILLATLLSLSCVVSAEIIDRVAVSVGNSVITTSGIEREIRLVAFQDNQPPDFSAANRRATADRMVERKLIEREMESSQYLISDPVEVDRDFTELRKRYPDDETFQRALIQYGITENELREQLAWQQTFTSFLAARFQPAVQVTEQDIQDYFTKVVEPAAKHDHPGEPVSLADYHDQIEDKLNGERSDEQRDAWLKEARKRTEVVYHNEALQ